MIALQGGLTLIQLNNQPTEPLTSRADGTLEVHSIWHTIQGEGPLAGMPAVFVRLTGCNLQCPGCDTEYTKNRLLFTPQQLVQQCVEVKFNHGGTMTRLVVITGGEPFRQNIVPFIIEASNANGIVQIETNGLLWQPHFDTITEPRPIVVCSPKAGIINPRLRQYVTALKYVVSADDIAHDGLPTRVLGMKGPIARPWEGFNGDIFLQPADEQDEDKNKRNIEAAVRSCLKFGYRMCLQTHKILGLD